MDPIYLIIALAAARPDVELSHCRAYSEWHVTCYDAYSVPVVSCEPERCWIIEDNLKLETMRYE